MNFQPWLEFVAVLAGAIFGSYLAVRVQRAEKLSAPMPQAEPRLPSPKSM